MLDSEPLRGTNEADIPPPAIDADAPAPAPTNETYTSQGAIPPVASAVAAKPTPSASDRAFGDTGARLVDTENGGLDVAAAETYNRAHVVDVVRFDRATHGQFARGDGQLDAVRLAKWQGTHKLPADGMVTENTCLVAEGKPPLPPSVEPYRGEPRVHIVHPLGETYAAGFPVPLTLDVMGPPGPVHLEIQLGAMTREIDITIGDDGTSTIDLRLDPPGPAHWDLEVQGSVGGTPVVARSAFDVELTGLLPPPQLGDEPPLPAPGVDRHAIDQADAEDWNRNHVHEVVRFDRATRGYFAKPNGELDALAVAEWQTQHGLVRTGKVDEITANKAVEQGGGLERGPDPSDQFHGAPIVDILQPTVDESVEMHAGSVISVACQTRSNTPLAMEWALVDIGTNRQLGVGQSAGHSDGKGTSTIFDMVHYTIDRSIVASLEIAVSTPLGASPVLKRSVFLKP